MMMVGRRRYVGIDAVVRRREEHLEQDLHGEPDFPVFAVGVDRGAVDGRQQDELCAPEHPVPRQKDPRASTWRFSASTSSRERSAMPELEASHLSAPCPVQYTDPAWMPRAYARGIQHGYMEKGGAEEVVPSDTHARNSSHEILPERSARDQTPGRVCDEPNVRAYHT